ncbi:Chitinase 2 [Ciborinia camelliae]|nr:Chitinase 2 [Ciborinia camelliae]
MYSLSSLTVAAATFALIAPSIALYDASSPANLALYWGSGPSQANLSYYCEQSTVDIIPLAFMNVFPAQGDGYPAEDFGNACYGQPIFTPGPGYGGIVDPPKDQLYVQCPGIQEGIPYCQSLGKKILLSLGGASATYQLTGADDGEYFADFLWGSYGPFKQSWLDAGGIRPMDGGYYGTDSSIHIDIDGFDFDIEIASTDSSEGYIAMINRLREHFAENPSKKYFISGAPQCPLPEPNMGAMIAGAQFDLLWIQFYNNDFSQCTARQWADNYALTGEEDSAEFTYDQWVSTINSGASAGASIYLGLLGSPEAGTSTDYISPLEAQSLIESYHGKPQFGGVMIWEATYSQENMDIELNGQSYHAFIKSCLSSYAPPPPTSTSSVVSSTTISSSSFTSKASITSIASPSIESSATPSSTSLLISESSAVLSSTSLVSSVYSSQFSAAPSSTSLKASITPSSTILSISESSAPPSLTPSESSGSPSLSASSIPPTMASSGYSIPGYSHNATSGVSHSTKPAGSGTLPVYSSKPTASYTFTGYSSKSTGIVTGHSSKPHTSKPSSGYTGPAYTFNSTLSGSAHSTKPYPTKSSVIGTGASTKPHHTKSSGTGVGSCRSKTKVKTKTKTKTSSTGPSGYPGSSSSILISSTAPYGNITYSQSRTKPASSFTSSAEGVTVSSNSATETESASSGSVPSKTSSALTSKSLSSGTGAITSPIQYTTSTAYVTSVYTITSCAATVTDCPGRIGSVTTETISSYTTVCPVSETSTSSAEGVTVSPKSSSSAQGLTVKPATPIGQYTTSTVYATTVYTVTSCAATVTDCPARIGSVTTEIISSYTTVCPVTETGGNGGIVSSTSFPSSAPTPITAITSYGTSTVYQTSVYTITSCAPSVTDCPARSGQLTTETISSYTSVYPVIVSSAPASVNIPSPEASSAAGVLTSVSSSAAEAASPTQLYTTKISTLIGSQTITISAVIAPSTITVVPIPVASTTLAPPYGAGNGTLVGTGSASASRVPKPSSYVIKAESESTSTNSGVPSPTTLQFEASGNKVVGKMGVVSCFSMIMLGLLLWA